VASNSIAISRDPLHDEMYSRGTGRESTALPSRSSLSNLSSSYPGGIHGLSKSGEVSQR